MHSRNTPGYYSQKPMMTSDENTLMPRGVAVALRLHDSIDAMIDSYRLLWLLSLPLPPLRPAVIPRAAALPLHKPRGRQTSSRGQGRIQDGML